MTSEPFTLVSFHAHPDDEALLTGGTLAKAAADGHRVVLVVATLGERGLADPSQFVLADLGRSRRRELRTSARRLGCARVVVLGYADSGSTATARDTDTTEEHPPRPSAPNRGPLAVADIDDAALRLADILIQERADVLTTYDAAGGYGHPDHVQVHRVGARAADLAGTPVVLEATIDRSKLLRAVRWLRRFSRLAPGLALPDFGSLYTAPEEITHQIDVRDHLGAKLDAMRAHASQSTSETGTRTLALLLRLPRPISRRILGREWFVERGREASLPPETDIFSTLRTRPIASANESRLPTNSASARMMIAQPLLLSPPGQRSGGR